MRRTVRKQKMKESTGAVLLLAVAALFQGCSSLTPGHAITDVALGAGGAGIGYVLGGGKGAAIGGGGGFLFGEGLNFFNDKKTRDEEEVGYGEGRPGAAKNMDWAQTNPDRK